MEALDECAVELKAVIRLGHLISWLLLLAVPAACLLRVLGWLQQPLGDLGTIGNVFLIIVAIVFLHGIVRAGTEAGTGL